MSVCVSLAASLFAIPLTVLVLLRLIGVYCIGSLVQPSDWHIDRRTEQVSRGKLVIASSVCQSNCPLTLSEQIPAYMLITVHVFPVIF